MIGRTNRGKAMTSEYPTGINSQESDSTVSDHQPADVNLSEQSTVSEENGVPTVEEVVNRDLITQLTQQNQSLKVQLEERSSQYMRIAADFDNYRRRVSKEKEDTETQVKRNTIMELLPVVDNFERARAHLKPQDDGEMTIHKSYQGVYKQLVDSLKKMGVSPMRPEGQEFDPNLHEAVMREQTSEHPEGTVLEELVRGYFLGDRVLRHAMVKVAAAIEDTVTEEKDQSDQDQI
ncbi:nucleotide exchange factor GrpE [Cylindrospermopsis raciborskii]